MKVKNSNKILLLILGLVIAIPMLVAMVLRHKVRTGQFQIERHVHQEDPALKSSGSLEGVRAIKLIGPLQDQTSAGFLGASLIHGNKTRYTLIKASTEDSVQTQRLGDTLIFSYYTDTIKETSKFRRFHQIRLVLELPGNIPILAENCKLAFESWKTDTLDGIHTTPALIYLKNGSILELGSDNMSYVVKKDTVTPNRKMIFVLDTSQATKDQFDSTFAPMTGFHVFASNSTVKFIQPLLFKDLELDMRDGSALELSHPFKAGHLSGKLDADTEIKGDIRGLRSIKALIKE